MANEFDSISLHNPTKEDFEWQYNGELFRIDAGEYKPFVRPVAFHLAKHLSTKMIIADAKKGIKPEQLLDQRNPVHLKVSQLQTYDTHERRIALFKLLGDIALVQECIQRYPFKGFIGEMELYKTFVDSQKPAPIVSEEELPEEEEAETPPVQRGRPRKLSRTIIGEEPKTS